MNLFKLLLSVVISICFVIPGIPCYLGVIYVLKKLYEYFKNLNTNDNQSNINYTKQYTY